MGKTDVRDTRPNIILVLADDLGYSDIGCYGSEIRTPNLDRLARAGVRLTQFYNTAKCCPSRASLLTGLHPHQTGIGVMTDNDSPTGYPGSLGDNCVTIAEVLREAGYATCMAGKWHLSLDVSTPDGNWPTQRGFEKFFGTLQGACSYYAPGTLTRGEESAAAESENDEFYYTDAIAAEGEMFIREHAHASTSGRPFFLYLAFTAPHWPLHAPEDMVQEYDGVYDAGWDELRNTRMQRLVTEEIVAPRTALSDRDPTQPAWDDVDDREWQARRMQTYAAQVAAMDHGVGRVLRALQETDQLENTLIVFLSDNGSSPEDLPLISEESFRENTRRTPRTTRKGQPVRVGNSADIAPGPEDTYASYGRAWANLSNTPFRFYKRWVHEGGISTPFIAYWPAGRIAGGALIRAPRQLIDVLPTFLEAASAPYPNEWRGVTVQPREGESMLSLLRREGDAGERPLYWEHAGNAAIRTGPWKLVREWPGPWELYDIETDRSELNNLANHRSDVVARLSRQWEHWAIRVGVKPWGAILRLYLERGVPHEEAALGLEYVGRRRPTASAGRKRILDG